MLDQTRQKKNIDMNTYTESQYDVISKSTLEYGLYELGPMASFTYNDDPKRLLFVLSRYKFAAKMLQGLNDVIEIGCGDGFGSRVIKQHVKRLVVTDFDPNMMASRKSGAVPNHLELNYSVWNPVTTAPQFSTLFGGAVALDVLEHVKPQSEKLFMNNICTSLLEDSVFVVGMPSIESQAYASNASKAGHVNCKTQEDLASLMKEYFRVVLTFSMNDEVVHTGFARMANYLFAVGVVKR